MRVTLIVVLATAVSSSAAAAWPGPPSGAAPNQPKGPPPAWAETSGHSLWLAFGSYCWSRPTPSGRSAICADMLPPQSRRDLPVLRVRLGEMVRVHLRFTPSQSHLTIFRGVGFDHAALSPGRVLVWRVHGFGITLIDLKAEAGSAGYLARLVRRP